MHSVTSSIFALTVTSSALALPPTTAIVGYGISRGGAMQNYVAIEFVESVLPQDIQALVQPLGGCLAVPMDGEDNLVGALSLLLIDSANPDENTAWIGVVHLPNDEGTLHWQSVEGGPAPYLAFAKGHPSNPPSVTLGAVLHAHSQSWFDARIDTGHSQVRRAIVSFPADLEDCDFDNIPDSLIFALGLDSDIDGNGILDWCVVPGDLNQDGVVNAPDLALLLAAWGTSTADIDGDGTTAASDLSLLLASWSQ